MLQCIVCTILLLCCFSGCGKKVGSRFCEKNTAVTELQTPLETDIRDQKA